MTATIAATIHNQGDVPVSSVPVRFLVGTTLIGTATIPGPLAGGESAAVSVGWTVPAAGAPHTLRVEVVLTNDANASDNTASLAGVVKPDAAIDWIRVDTLANRLRVFTVRVSNAGSVALPPTRVRLYLNHLGGPPLGTVLVPSPLAPGAYFEGSVAWMPSGTLPTSATAHAVVDELNLIDEFDEQNNSRTVTIGAPRQRQ